MANIVEVRNREVFRVGRGCCCSVAQSCPTLCNPRDCSRPGSSVHHYLPEFAQTHVHCVGGAMQPSHPLSSPSPPAFNLSQHQGLSQWAGGAFSEHSDKMTEELWEDEGGAARWVLGFWAGCQSRWGAAMRESGCTGCGWWGRWGRPPQMGSFYLIYVKTAIFGGGLFWFTELDCAQRSHRVLYTWKSPTFRNYIKSLSLKRWATESADWEEMNVRDRPSCTFI